MHLAAPSRRLSLRRSLFAPVLVVSAVALAACSSSPSANKATTTTTSATTTTAPASTTTTTTATPTCATSTLSVSVTASGGTAGSGSETFTLTNTGSSTCGLNGYATITFYGASGAGGAGAGPKLDITDVDGGGPATEVVLAPKSAASFLVEFPQVPVNGAGCVSIASAHVIPPGNTEALELPVSVQSCGTSVTVDPVSAASAGTGGT